jgi:predicted nucleic acid-binding protein
MPRYFVDTWFFIAEMHERDSDHRFALNAARRLNDASFVTHDGVLTELLTFFSGFGEFWRSEAAMVAHRVTAHRRFETLPLSRELFMKALHLYERRLDKEYSLVDCASMVIMRDHGITHALTNDHHFEQEGFHLVNE